MTLSSGNRDSANDNGRADRADRAGRDSSRSNSSNSASGTGAAGRAGRAGTNRNGKPRVDQDIRNHPDYKTPWWRKPLKPAAFWAIFAIALVIVIAAVVVCLSLGIRLF